MPFWQIHFLNARHGLTRIMPELRQTAAQAVALAGAHAELPDFDLIVRAGEGIPEWGVGGYAPGAGVVELTLNPARFDPEPVIRTLLHEFHHLIRWDGPGYGRSLGEALVSEGLAGHFVRQVLGGPPDPWDATPVTQAVAKRAITEWARRDYHHAEWFFGAGGGLRRWVGYGLGHRLAGLYLDLHEGETPASLALIGAEGFRPVMRRLAAEGEPEPEPEPDLKAGADPAQSSDPAGRDDTPRDDASPDDAVPGSAST